MSRYVFVLVLVAMLAACGGAPAVSTTPAPASTAAPVAAGATSAPATEAPSATTVAATDSTSLRVAIAADEGTLQPYTYVTGYPGWNMLNLVYDTLLILDADNIPQPWLAISHEVSEDGLTHTLTLREGVTWHDGTPFTSADVQFSYEYYQANRQSRWTPPLAPVTEIQTPDEQTVVITLEQPSPSFALQPLADAPIIPQHLWADVTDPKTFENNVGTGPFVLAEYESEQFYRFTANPDYFAGSPAVAELVMPIIAEPTTIFASLQTGEIDATVRGLPPELVEQFQAVDGLEVVRGPGYSTTMLQFNNERAPWGQREVRQAVALAINRQQLIDTVLLGFGTIGNPGWLHPASPFHDPAVQAQYDVAQANALLDGLGYTDSDGDGVREANGAPIEAEFLVYSNNPTRIRTAELITAALEEIGMRLNVTALDPDSVDAQVWPEFDVAKGRDFDLAMWGWSAPVQVNAPRMITLVHSDPAIGSLNIGGFKSADADRVAEEWNRTSDQAQQQELARELERIVADEVPFVVLFYEDGNYAYQAEAYNGWVYQKGQGIFQKLSFVPDVTP